MQSYTIKQLKRGKILNKPTLAIDFTHINKIRKHYKPRPNIVASQLLSETINIGLHL